MRVLLCTAACPPPPTGVRTSVRPRTSRRSLLIGDQIALLKGAAFEVMEIRFNMVFNTKTGLWECGHATYCIEDAVRGEASHLYDYQGVKIGLTLMSDWSRRLPFMSL